MSNETKSQNFIVAQTSITNLSYEEKVAIREWLEEQIQKEMSTHTKQRLKEVQDQFGNFLDKASDITSKGANSLRDSFNNAFKNDQQ